MVAVLGLYLASAASAAFASTATSADQPLSIRVHGEGAEATRLPAYDPRVPITIGVTDPDGPQIDTLRAVAIGPGGTALDVPLRRAANGAFTGSVTLADPGTWRLRLLSRSGPLNTGTTPISLEVQLPPPSNAGPIGWGVGTAIFILMGGGGFALLRRALRPPAPRELQKAA